MIICIKKFLYNLKRIFAIKVMGRVVVTGLCPSEEEMLGILLIKVDLSLISIPGVVNQFSFHQFLSFFFFFFFLWIRLEYCINMKGAAHDREDLKLIQHQPWKPIKKKTSKT